MFQVDKDKINLGALESEPDQTEDDIKANQDKNLLNPNKNSLFPTN
jgi:hypothetical protein